MLAWKAMRCNSHAGSNPVSSAIYHEANMNRRVFLKVLIGTVAVVALDPLKVLAEKLQQVPKKELDFEIKQTHIEPITHARKPGLEIQTDPASKAVLKELGENNTIIDLVRISYPAMIAHELCSVQPMTQSTGQIFTVRYVPKPWYKRMGNWFKKKPKVHDGCWGDRCGHW